MSKFTPQETVDSILWDSKSMDVKQLSQKYGVHGGTIRAMLRRHGLKPIKPDPQRFIIPKEKLEATLANGWMGIYDLAAEFGCSYAKVNKSLKFHGILRGRKPTVRHRLRDGNRAFKVLGYIMANPELALEFVAKQFNCTREYVSQIDAMARKEGIIK